ncbi:MAG: disulfide bond formation protein B [Planctomycetia bacterium]|nr:disulfide bond formation protein B [Planctomycetia bacterium]
MSIAHPSSSEDVCSPRTVPLAWVACAVAAAGTAGSLFLSLGLGLKACPLCFYQRTFVMAAFSVGLVGLWIEPKRPGLTTLLMLPLSWAGLGVAAFHESLVMSGKLECPLALFGLGTAPAQSLTLFVLLVAVNTLAAWSGRCESARSSAAIPAVFLFGGLLAYGSIATAPPLPPTPTAAYDPVKQPLEMCRPPFRGSPSS